MGECAKECSLGEKSLRDFRVGSVGNFIFDNIDLIP